MPEFVFDMPPRNLAIMFTLLAIGAVVCGLLVIKPLFRVLFGTGPEFNANLAFGASGFNLFYGLLLGLLTVSAYQNSEQVRKAIQNEALSVGVLYTQVDSYPEPWRSDLQVMLRDYVLYTIHRDWPAHRQGAFLDGGTNRSEAMGRTLTSFEPTTDGQAIMHQASIDSFRDFNKARQERLSGVLTRIPQVLWYAVLVGAAVNVLLLVLLRMRLHTQFMVGTITSCFLGVILFVIVTLDKPLRGVSGLPPVPFELL